MAKLTYAERKALPDSAFAVKGRHYPTDTPGRARNALARVSKWGSDAEKAAVKMRVKSKYPKIHVGE